MAEVGQHGRGAWLHPGPPVVIRWTPPGTSSPVAGGNPGPLARYGSGLKPSITKAAHFNLGGVR